MRPFLLLRVLPAVCAAAVGFVASGAATNALAASDRKPLVLDTESGIDDGQSGVVLQTAPLSRQPMVAAKRAAAPTELQQPDSSQPIIVAPYINLPVGGASAPRPVYRPNSSQ
ncbi:hypothetical protein FAZ69_32805 [Trinickia terrae]|uniref:Uncharacterized protein n=1 Tax=Trinickia terrae TaxID=2571161 RepID=A0A4U1HBU8_9BURK|nr:hypothetical protein [Trinickia terrae]TKC77283.1 hypothetical protein FAZ69_32805 [Trinickia terrae]